MAAARLSMAMGSQIACEDCASMAPTHKRGPCPSASQSLASAIGYPIPAIVNIALHTKFS